MTFIQETGFVTTKCHEDGRLIFLLELTSCIISLTVWLAFDWI